MKPASLITLSSIFSISVSIVKSGVKGSSYGEEIPVKSLISDLNAFAYKPLTSLLTHSSNEAFI